MNNYQLTINEVIEIINRNTDINKLVAKKDNLYPTDLYDLDKQQLIAIILNSDFALSSIKRALLEVTVEELGEQDNDDDLDEIDSELYEDAEASDVPHETIVKVFEADKSIVTFNGEKLKHYVNVDVDNSSVDEVKKIAKEISEHDFNDEDIEEAELKTFKNHLPTIYSMKKENK
ncbi:replication protein [Bacillus phage PZA]|uniref:DNA replication protein 17 n=1 Tax=Bacillus phage PZA TaxID=10757 RepID=GP17_BPPZA|nr:replication protein [Bacillus phage PZA]P08389.1 RecName: Full=DNA replication protein 17; AltName: Full=Gene product 17; Short=gp17; AltName: Full=Protein p17 [Bacillus phage PZA]AAA88499.1 gene 17 product [Bacillus phage PZA]